MEAATTTLEQSDLDRISSQVEEATKGLGLICAIARDESGAVLTDHVRQEIREAAVDAVTALFEIVGIVWPTKELEPV